MHIPAWAYVDVTRKDTFNLVDAQALGRELRVNPRQDNFSYTSPKPSFTSSPSFVYPYPIPTSFSVPSYSFSVPSYSFSAPSYSYSAPSYSFSAPSYTFSFSTPTYNFPTAAPGYSVPSIPTGLSSPEEHGSSGGGGKISSSKRKVNLKAIIGGVVGAVSSVAAFIGGVWAWMKRRAKRALGLSQGEGAHAAEQQKPFMTNNPATNLPHVPYEHPAPPVPVRVHIYRPQRSTY